MRVLVTGGASFIGSAVARACVERGWVTGAFDNLVTGFESAVPEGVALIRGHLGNLDAVTQVCEEITFIDDAVVANLLAADADAIDGSVINIGGRAKTVNDVLHSVSAAVGQSIEPIFRPKRLGNVRHTRADISRAREGLGWKPEADWAYYLRAKVRWLSAGKTNGIERS